MAETDGTFLDYDETLGHADRRQGVQVSTGAPDGGKIPRLGADGRFDGSMMPAGFGDEPAQILAGENIAAGDLVNIYNDAGTTKIRKADGSTTGKEAHAWAPSAITNATTGGVRAEGLNTVQTGLTAGPVYLSQTVPGKATSTKPSLAGGIAQRVGTADAAGSFIFEAQDPIGL